MGEIGGGSMRIHESELQKYILEDILKVNTTDLTHMLEALTWMSTAWWYSIGTRSAGGHHMQSKEYQRCYCLSKDQQWQRSHVRFASSDFRSRQVILSLDIKRNLYRCKCLKLKI